MDASHTCHDLLIRLAGRLPDELMWRLRDWLAADGRASIAAVLPRELLRHRVGLTDDERGMLVASVGAWGAVPRLLDAVLPVLEPPSPTADFRPAPEVDPAALAVLAVVRGHPGVAEVRQAWRDEQQRVIVVLGGERPWQLAGTVQRLLRAQGDRTPCVEVLPPHGDPPDYHRAAIIGSAPLWRTAALVGSRS